MRKPLAAFVVLFLALGLGIGGYAFAQDGSMPTGGADACASPAASPEAMGDMAGMDMSASPEASPCASPAAGGTPVEVDMVDIAFTQKELTIPANTDVTLHIVNQGAAVHNFTIDNPSVMSGDVQPGQSVDITVNLPAGTYEYYCSQPGHKQAGMVGTLTVQ